MGQGNPNKVNAIVDEIVKNNSVFKLKSPIEQDKEKDSMARSINSALSVLNEVGKELVLQDLSVDPDEKFKGFIDSVGNIDISGLTKMTATIVKAKIEEAEREGLNLRTGEPVFKNYNKTLVAEGILTVAVIDTMIRNFDKLTSAQKASLAENWENMIPEQRKEYTAALGKSLAGKLSVITNKDTRKKVKEISETLENHQDYPIDIETVPKEKLITWLYLENPNPEEKFENLSDSELRIIARDTWNKKINKTYVTKANTVLEELEKLERNPNDEQEKTKLEKIVTDIDLKKAHYAKLFAQMQYKGLIREDEFSVFDFMGLSLEQQENVLELVEKRKSEYKTLDIQKYLEMSESDQYQYFKQFEKTEMHSKISPKIQQDIEQLPIALTKAGFSLENITEALTIYVDFVKEIDDEVIEDFKTKDEKELIGFVKEYFSEYKEQLAPKSFKVLEILASNTFGGQLQQILTNPQLLQETFLPALSAEIEKLEQQPIPDEHTDEYYRSQATTLTLDRNVEEIAKKVQAQGGSVKEITVALAKKIEERATEQSQHSIPEEESKEQKTEQPTPPIFENPTIPEEPTPESATSPEQETLEETGQNMAMVKQDNSFIGKIRRVFANMKDMKNKDNSKGFFARLGASIKTVFGNKEEHYEEQDSTSTAPTPEIQSQSTARREPINYITQHFEVNESIARKETEKSKKEKDFSNADDRTTDEEEK